jgi:hypothetical protein
VCFSGDGRIGIIQNPGEPTMWLHDVDLPELKSKNGGSFTPTLWDQVKISEVLQCSALTLVTDGFARFFDVNASTESASALPGTKSEEDDSIDVSDFYCDDDGSDRSQRGLLYPPGARIGWENRKLRLSLQDSEVSDPLTGGGQKAQGRGWWFKSSPVASKSDESDLRNGETLNVTGVDSLEPPIEPGSQVPLADDLDGSVSVEVPVVDPLTVVSSSTPEVVESTAPPMPADAVSVPPRSTSVRKSTPAKVPPQPVEDLEPFRHLIDGTAITTNPGDLDRLVTVPNRKAGDDETCVSAVVLPESDFVGEPDSISNVFGYGIEETSNLRVMYGFKSTSKVGGFVKSVTIQPDVTSEQLVLSVIVSLEGALYEKAQKVGALAIQLLCDAIVRTRGSGYENALLDVFRQIVTTRNIDGRFINVALIVQDSKHAHYWCTGKFFALSADDDLMRIEPGIHVTFGKLQVPFILMPNNNEGDEAPVVSDWYAYFTSLTAASEAQVSRELIKTVGICSKDSTFLVSPKVPDKEPQRKAVASNVISGQSIAPKSLVEGTIKSEENKANPNAIPNANEPLKQISVKSNSAVNKRVEGDQVNPEDTPVKSEEVSLRRLTIERRNIRIRAKAEAPVAKGGFFSTLKRFFCG